jgi:hypothetical protein
VLNHGVTFPLMAKSEVNGDSTNEVYKWLKSQKAGILGLTRIKVGHLSSEPVPHSMVARTSRDNTVAYGFFAVVEFREVLGGQGR